VQANQSVSQINYKEKLTNLAKISAESETAKTSDMTELPKSFAFLKTWKKSFV